MKPDCKKLVARYHRLQSDRKITEEVWELIERFIYPIGGSKYFQPLSTEGEMQWRRRYIYDDTAINGADTLAASIHGSLTSPAVKWFDLGFDIPALSKSVEAQSWLDQCAEITWDAIQASNFNREIAEGYLDLVSFGNTLMMHLPVDDLKWEGVRFDAVPLREIYFDEDEDDQVCTLFRRLSWKPSQICDKFGDATPEKIKKRAEASDTTRIELIHCIYKDDNVTSTSDTVVSIEKRKYKSCYILTENAEMIGDLGGFHEMPAYMTRWRRAPGSQWGYGPGHLAISSVMTLNELVKLVLESAEKVIDPPSLVQRRGLMSDLDLSPGGQIIVNDIDKAARPYESGARFDVSALQVADLRDMIRRLFHVDQLELKESPAMSATEVMVRYELMNRLLGPTMGRLQSDLLDPLINNTFMMLYRARKFPEMPDVVAEAGGEMHVRYVGPLSRAQKSDDIASVERWLTDIANFSQIFPDLRHVPNPVEIAKFLAKGLNIPADLMKSDPQIKAAQNKDKQAQEQATQNEFRAQEAEISNIEQGAGAA
jgi:hypothetical protein